MTAAKRIQKELEGLAKTSNPGFRLLDVDESNINNWRVLLLPEKAPYNKGAFKIEINFAVGYPFKPPKVTFLTKIYHPNIDEKGQVCLPIIASENWKPATRMEQVIQALVKLVNEPEPEHPLRADISQEYVNNLKKFMKNAEDFTKKHSEKRT